MPEAVAANTVRSTRQRAEADASSDLANLRETAIEAGRERSRRIIKSSIIDHRTGYLRYNPGGRILRDWYFHVYLNTLRSNLGEPAIPIDAQQVEDTTVHLRRVRPGIEPLHALRAVAVARDTAIADAAHATLNIVQPLAEVAARRAIRHAPDDRFDADELAIHITRHWYQRCYDDTIHGATATRQPFTEITAAEEHQVALCLAAGEARRLVTPQGLPLMTVHGMIATDVDRRLAAGGTGLVSPISDVDRELDRSVSLRQRIEQTWGSLDIHSRRQWLQSVAVFPESIERSWEHLRPYDQLATILTYIDAHSVSQSGGVFQAKALSGEPRLAATTMFGHTAALVRDSDPRMAVETGLAVDRHPEAIHDGPHRGVGAL